MNTDYFPFLSNSKHVADIFFTIDTCVRGMFFQNFQEKYFLSLESELEIGMHNIMFPSGKG